MKLEKQSCANKPSIQRKNMVAEYHRLDIQNVKNQAAQKQSEQTQSSHIITGPATANTAQSANSSIGHQLLGQNPSGASVQRSIRQSMQKCTSTASSAATQIGNHQQQQSSITMGTARGMEHSEYSQNIHHMHQQIISILYWSAGTAPEHNTCQ
ncbi:hypothetical protein Nepgr_002697 [Nepenthes gracilis]|uniref:Uncharacterized protein n=1 Tax=Nepenthes gracilis TaxID=150966 RepID=A0AAD3RYE5_NEPGR|nr:hypothetical protein Nepgr_002697 [Nepenthes gracilis]